MPKKIRTHHPGGVSPQERRRQYDRDRGSSRQFYSSSAWRRFRRTFLRAHPICARCLQAAYHVHHVKPRQDFPELAYDPNNCEGLCAACHNRQEKTKTPTNIATPTA